MSLLFFTRFAHFCKDFNLLLLLLFVVTCNFIKKNQFFFFCHNCVTVVDMCGFFTYMKKIMFTSIFFFCFTVLMTKWLPTRELRDSLSRDRCSLIRPRNKVYNCRRNKPQFFIRAGFFFRSFYCLLSTKIVSHYILQLSADTIDASRVFLMYLFVCFRIFLTERIFSGGKSLQKRSRWTATAQKPMDFLLEIPSQLLSARRISLLLQRNT